MNKQVLLNAIDGVLAQAATAHAYYESHNVDGLPMQSVYSSLTMVRLLVEDEPDGESEGAEPGECTHPNPERTEMMAGNYYVTCPDCQSIIEQGGPS